MKSKEVMRVYLSSPYEHSRAATSWKNQAEVLMRHVDRRVEIVDPCPDACDESPFIDKMKADEDWVGMYSFCAKMLCKLIGFPSVEKSSSPKSVGEAAAIKGVKAAAAT